MGTGLKNMYIFDSHAHYNDEKFDDDRETILKDIWQAGITKVIVAGYSIESSKEAISIVEKEDWLYATCGISPNDLVPNIEEAINTVKSLCKSNKKVVAIGEIGLDYHYDTNREIQKQAFIKHINSLPFYGCAMVCTDSPLVKEVLPYATRKYITYGFKGNPDITATDITVVNGNTEYNVIYKGKKLGKILLKVPGEHNVLNSLAAIGIGLQFDIPFVNIKNALFKFGGVGRRLEVKGEKNGITVVDDYGHHPTEINATLSALKHNYPHKRLVTIFQPHRYTRTKNLYKEFGKALKKADVVYVMDIYAASEKPIKGVTSDLIITAAKENKCNVQKFVDIESVAKTLKENDILLTLGAGNVWQQGEELLKHIEF